MDADLRELVDAWLDRAARDRLAAERLEPDEDERGGYPLYGVAAFHRQQAAEKALKALLSAHSVEFKKTHDLSRLLGLAAETAPVFSELESLAATLAPFAVEIRYPGDWDDLTAEEYAEVKDASTTIVARVEECLADLG
ncbi:MAG: HEPN domain-containing protein [Armatimonadetes bacterium]|nr:HEPN domain-containing protein [Armatimonadota bacterium]